MPISIIARTIFLSALQQMRLIVSDSKNIVVIIFMSAAAIGTISGQRVTVADEINVRADQSYDIVGQVQDNIILYRNKGKKHLINIYDENLRFKREKELLFEDKDANVIYIYPTDTTVNITYSYEEDDTLNFKINTFDKNMILIDSLNIDKQHKRDQPKYLFATSSEDNRYTVLFFNKGRKDSYIRLIDNEKKEMVWYKMVSFKNVNLRNDFRQIEVTNRGEIIYLFETDNSRFSRNEHLLSIVVLKDSGVVKSSTVDVSGYVSSSTYMKYNNNNGFLAIIGLSSEKNTNAATDYYFVNKPLSRYQEIEKPEKREFGLDFIKEVYGRDKHKEKELKDYKIKDLVLRQDGGFILIGEMNREFTRRTSFSNFNRQNRNINNDRLGWTDYYHEDVIFVSVHPDGQEHWRNILYKKQFSQDDGGFFSSFFLFMTSSRLRLIYNDEIKKNNTVSEYVLDPIGTSARLSLLTTEYQNLKLRFQDAIQINNHQIIVPSEKSFKLRLVKIDYDEYN